MNSNDGQWKEEVLLKTVRDKLHSLSRLEWTKTPTMSFTQRSRINLGLQPNSTRSSDATLLEENTFPLSTPSTVYTSQGLKMGIGTYHSSLLFRVLTTILALYTALYQWILGGMTSIGNHIRSRFVFLTAWSPAECDENNNTSERQFYLRGCWSRLVAHLRPSIVDLESDDDGLRPPRVSHQSPKQQRRNR